jgi:hypothetical protein
MNLLAAVFDYLHAREIGAAAIGGVALAAHGIVRATLDADVLVTDPRVLRAEFWAGLSGARAEARSGDGSGSGGDFFAAENVVKRATDGRPEWSEHVVASHARRYRAMGGPWCRELFALSCLS